MTTDVGSPGGRAVPCKLYSYTQGIVGTYTEPLTSNNNVDTQTHTHTQTHTESNVIS
jgi:hypothetical protein